MVAQKPDVVSVAALRAVTYRISNTPSEQLPQVAPQIAAALWHCRDLLASSIDARNHGDASVLVHRFNNQISTLLQDRTISGRWAAVVITKAAVEASGLEGLSKCNAWVRHLLGILKKPDPPTTRRLAVILLTRIFALTWPHPNLVREITTPALPVFLSACLNNIESKRCSSGELQTILNAFVTLLARHTTTFRSHEQAIRNLLTRVLSDTTSTAEYGTHYTQHHRSSAYRLFVLLHNCAPKQGAGEKWTETTNTIIAAAHAVCGLIYRAVQEEWKSTTGVQPLTLAKGLPNGDVAVDTSDALGLKAWQGLHAGSERLVVLLHLLRAHIEGPAASSIVVRAGTLTDLLTRILSVTPPLSEKTEHLKPNHEIPKEERDSLFAVIPNIHVAAIDAARSLVVRLGCTAISMQKVLFDMMVWIFPAEQIHLDAREALFHFFKAALEHIGPSLDREDVADMAPILKTACMDLLPLSDLTKALDGNTNGALVSTKQGFHSYDPKTNMSPTGILYDAARRLIQCALEQLPAACIAPKLRAQIDRTATLLQDRSLLLASVLNPPTKTSDGALQPSLLPILARMFPCDPEVEALLRPRLPPIRGQLQLGEDDSTSNRDEDEQIPVPIDNYDDAEPTAGLMTALTRDIEPINRIRMLPAEEVKESLSIQSSSHTKRTAKDDLVSGASPKRSRASPAFQNLAQYNGLPQLGGNGDSALISSEDIDHHNEESRTEMHSINYAPSGPMPMMPATLRGASPGSENDGSDFEMPPLTMDPDTDPEDE